MPMQHTVSHNESSTKKGTLAYVSAMIIGIAAADPHVPGAGRILPIQKQVAKSTAGWLHAGGFPVFGGS